MSKLVPRDAKVAPPLSAAAVSRRPKKRKSPGEKTASPNAAPVRISDYDVFGQSSGWTRPARSDQGSWDDSW